MHHRLLAALLLAIVTVASPAQTDPRGTSPEFVLVVAVKGKNTVVLESSKATIKLVEVVKTVKEGSEVRAVKYTQPVLEYAPRTYYLTLGEITAKTVAGKTVAGAAAWKKLVGKAAVVQRNPGQPIDPVYLAALAPDTVIITPRQTRMEPAPAGPNAPTPAQVNVAMTALQPILAQRSITTAPTPISDPLVHEALPGVVVVPVPRARNEDGKRPGGLDLVVVAPGQKPVIHEKETSVFEILSGYPPVLTDEAARQYVRVHLLLVAVRTPQLKPGPFGPITVTPRDKGGRTAEGELLIVSGPKNNTIAAYTLTVSFNKDGKRLGGKRGARSK